MTNRSLECGNSLPLFSRDSSRQELGDESPRKNGNKLPHSGYRGLTLAEVLATVAIMAIVLPVIMQAISISTALASTTRLRSQATYLAEMKLDELVASGEWKTAALSGDFGAQWPGFRWESSVSDWDEADMRQLQVSVSYFSRGQDRQIVLTTLVYDSSTLSEESSSL